MNPRRSGDQIDFSLKNITFKISVTQFLVKSTERNEFLIMLNKYRSYLSNINSLQL